MDAKNSRDQLAEYRQAARRRYLEHVQKREEQETFERVREFMDRQRRELRNDGFTDDQVEALMWPFDEAKEIVVAELQDNKKSIGAQYLVQFKTDNGVMHTESIRTLTHLARFQGTEPPRYKNSRITPSDWKKIAHRWSLVSPQTRGVRPLSTFRSMTVEVDSAHDGADDSLSAAERHGAHFAILDQHTAALISEMASGPHGISMLEVVAESPLCENVVYLPVGNPVRGARAPGVLQIDARLASRVGWAAGTPVQVRAVQVPDARTPPDASVLLSLQNITPTSIEPTPEDLRAALETLNTLTLGQSVVVFGGHGGHGGHEGHGGPEECHRHTATYTVKQLIGDQGPCEVLFVGGREVAVDFEDGRDH